MRVVALFVVSIVLAACGGPSVGPEEQLRLWVQNAEAHAEAKDRAALMDMISSAYTDARGYDAEEVDRLFRLYFLRIQDVSLVSKIDEINVSADSAAEMLLTVGMLGQTGGTLGLDADAYRFALELERDGDEWLLIGARYAPLGHDLY